ncbi:anti-repressor SinI family protein [Aquibacillus koreensis]
MDKEWISLIKEAKDLGLTIEEVREFLLSSSVELGTTRKLTGFIDD